MTDRPNRPAGLPDPVVAPINEGMWRAAAGNQLAVQRCQDCGAHRYPPGDGCYRCSSCRWEWSTLPGTGVVYSYAWIPDRTPEFGLAPGLDLREDIGDAVVELRTAEQDARKIHRRPGQPAILTDSYHYRDILTVPGDDLRRLAHYRTDHLAEALLGGLDLPVIRSR